jgi:hypothetical protein
MTLLCRLNAPCSNWPRLASQMRSEARYRLGLVSNRCGISSMLKSTRACRAGVWKVDKSFLKSGIRVIPVPVAELSTDAPAAKRKDTFEPLVAGRTSRIQPEIKEQGFYLFESPVTH